MGNKSTDISSNRNYVYSKRFIEVPEDLEALMATCGDRRVNRHIMDMFMQECMHITNLLFPGVPSHFALCSPESKASSGSRSL
jgi:hypothetical protein